MVEGPGLRGAAREMVDRKQKKGGAEEGDKLFHRTCPLTLCLHPDSAFKH